MGNCSVCNRDLPSEYGFCSRDVPQDDDQENGIGRLLLAPSSEKLPTLQQPRRDSDSSMFSTVATTQSVMTVPLPTWKHIGHFCVTYCPLVVGALSLILFLAIINIVVMPSKQAVATTSTTSTTSSTTTTSAFTLTTTTRTRTRTTTTLTTTTVSHSSTSRNIAANVPISVIHTSATTSTTTTVRRTTTTTSATTPRSNRLSGGDWTQLMSMTVENLDYTKLMSQPRLLGDFRFAVCKTLAVETGDNLTAQEIRLQLMPGSVLVVANANTSKLQGRSPRLPSSANLRARLVASIRNVAGINTASTGRISVVDFHKVSQPWVGFPSAPWFLQHGPMLAIVACSVLLVLGMIALVRRFCFRISVKDKAPSSTATVEPPSDKIHMDNTGARAGGKNPRLQARMELKARTESKVKAESKSKERDKVFFISDAECQSNSSSSSSCSSSNSSSSDGGDATRAGARDLTPRKEAARTLKVPRLKGAEPEALAPPPRQQWRSGRDADNSAHRSGPRHSSSPVRKMKLKTIAESPASTPRVSPAVSLRNSPVGTPRGSPRNSPRVSDAKGSKS